ncbi:LLM class flavin-dependent oxidoreductase [Pandoraea nosoerga]|uniref:Luciferase-like monooxygenase n=1 Tax=Pandoraea nosoerga TaxID=2508296 RepID=A0A5E4RI06_9BURK|nr:MULTISPECIES: LLM class flavin-dependent oxidoreductase [Pandoraea]MBN4664442.1 LLM class flavin-dependent oxidoreductase [Pandoraea nosoerga]MBN4674522.1 LLM class flavin-dependent oxidoreductase [Pandoraea nosoerga]MBN4679790.1 LLM class flavin-dependent oxidoreductase [Pandoraea nosoerga]MBN4743122.1 LLM class flavin-dependent oxidoreductase [Pandoraea nosoerga]VVD62451.1 LLM class flavin-dependent oxidoreductase [Pandoraea nosoerga]
MSSLSKTALSMLDLVPVRAGGTVAEALKQSTELAQHVERLGFTRFWLAEHHNMDGIASSATALLIGHVAGKTSRIRVGSGGVMLPNHPPLVVAENFGTLAALYPGRIDLGLGRAPGADQATMRALRRDRLSDGDDFPEQVAELRALLAPAQPGQRLVATPGAGSDIPVWLLGSSLFSAQLAAHLGLPYAFASHFAPRFMFDAIRLYRDLFRPSAVLDKPYVMIGVPVVAAPTDEEAAYLATSAQQKILALMRGQSLKLQPPVHDMDERWDPAEQHSVEAFLGVAVVGGPQRVQDGLSHLVERTRADELMLVTDVYDPALRLRSCDIVASVWKA